ncbi:hypothetical protein L211DRAFT_421388 [Terfezia boudieri ATCC MYA-4762]|uniref:Uncharacterized protein n=1 Tax=Terfezia boudieri ATCC MYA-4762 TaxID=1051890 RepID=A0A3N4LFB4_9PEZI|nr:hypothetical protein L211DRAFT_421388 [Terfezia boudieri ATCC MYA-4762]
MRKKIINLALLITEKSSKVYFEKAIKYHQISGTYLLVTTIKKTVICLFMTIAS